MVIVSGSVELRLTVPKKAFVTMSQIDISTKPGFLAKMLKMTSHSSFLERGEMYKCSEG